MRLVTYNIHKGIGGSDRRYNLGRIQRVLAQLDADLVCLQEVTFDLPRTKSHAQDLLLAENMPDFFPFFQKTVHWQRGGYGNLILSRWPILEHHGISLRQGLKKPRGAQLALIETPGGPLWLGNWHLGLTQGERAFQVHHLLHHPLWRARDGHPTVLAGDSNDWRNRIGPTWLESAGLTGACTPPSRFRTFPAGMPVLPLDKVFHSPQLVCAHAHAPKNRLTRMASDHLPMVVDLRWV